MRRTHPARMAAVVLAIAGILVGSAAGASAAPTLAAPTLVAQNQRPLAFPHFYANVRIVPINGPDGKPSPWNTVRWDHATVLTRSHTHMVGTSGLTGVVAGANISPVSALARSAARTYQGSTLIPRGGCLALYWSDEPFVGPDGKRVQVLTQDLWRGYCRP